MNIIILDPGYLPSVVTEPLITLPLSLSPPPAACLFLLTLLLYVLWMEVVEVRRYVLQERGDSCPHARVSVHYGPSFMAAGAGVPLELVSGLVFMQAGRALQAR